MARKYLSVSRSVALSLAALLVLTGAMFMVTTFQQDSEEWVLVEDQVFDDAGYFSIHQNIGTENDSAEYVFAFDEETSTYSYEVTGGTKSSSSIYSSAAFVAAEGFDYSKQYKISIVSSDCAFDALYYIYGANYEKVFDLKTVEAGDDGYSASIVLLDQLITDFEYKDYMFFSMKDAAASTTFDANSVVIQVYELQTDNTGSIAAGFTGLVLIVMGVFAMPMHNILRRK